VRPVFGGAPKALLWSRPSEGTTRPLGPVRAPLGALKSRPFVFLPRRTRRQRRGRLLFCRQYSRLWPRALRSLRISPLPTDRQSSAIAPALGIPSSTLADPMGAEGARTGFPRRRHRVGSPKLRGDHYGAAKGGGFSRNYRRP
jgi:hypothetical protein